ncbi:hypothetical protein HZB02_05235 [Candidatus Woesearchaeota archaeon]|nr:hypothetical protein [Candidatus Woesearchaeota archaeon]
MRLQALLFAYVSAFYLSSGSPPPLKVTDALHVNLDNSVIEVILKNEDRGRQDIRRLLAFSSDEEEWVFLSKESLRKGQNSLVLVNRAGTIDRNVDLWMESGFNNFANGVHCRPLDDLAQFYSTLVYYHFHPRLLVTEDCAKYLKNHASQKIPPAGQDTFLSYCKSYSGLPSDEDIRSMIMRSVHAQAVVDGTRVINNVCSEVGIVEYRLTGLGLTHFKAMNEQELYTAAGDLSTRMTSDSCFCKPDKTLDWSQQPSIPIPRLMNQLTQQLQVASSGLVYVRYIPY